MRVLLVSHHAPPHIGGVENLVRMEAEGLVAAGHEVVWVTSDGGGAGDEVPPHERLRVVRVRALHWFERWFGIAYPLFAPTLPVRLWREVWRADLVHVHGLVFPGSPIAAAFARLLGVQCVCTDHGGLLSYRSRVGTWALRVLIETAGRLTARCAHLLVAYNRVVEALLVRLGGDARKVRFLPNPVDPRLFHPPTAAERAAARAALGWDTKPRVLCVSRLLPHKGIDVLLAAQHPAFALVFCGPGDETMREHIRRHGAECLDPRPQADVVTLYHAADVFALPSYNEGFPVAIQEALACGLPVVTSDLPAYAPYRDTPGLRLCEARPEAVRASVLDALRTRRRGGPEAAATAHADTRRATAGEDTPPATAGQERSGPEIERSAPGIGVIDTRTATAAGEGAHGAWLGALGVPPDASGGESARGSRLGRAVLLLLLLAHLAIGIGRLPTKVWARRLEEIADYRAQGAAHYLLDGARLGGADVIEWLTANTAEDSVILWRWPADGALEFTAALLAPRWIVDERCVAAGDTTFAGRPIAHGTLPTGERGLLTVQGTEDEGLELRVNPR
jgi:glycosyltransferase involved in cell wall biosynthesis